MKIKTFEKKYLVGYESSELRAIVTFETKCGKLLNQSYIKCRERIRSVLLYYSYTGIHTNKNYIYFYIQQNLKQKNKFYLNIHLLDETTNYTFDVLNKYLQKNDLNKELKIIKRRNKYVCKDNNVNIKETYSILLTKVKGESKLIKSNQLIFKILDIILILRSFRNLYNFQSLNFKYE